MEIKIEQGKLLNRDGVESYYEDRWLYDDDVCDIMNSDSGKTYTLLSITAQESKQFEIDQIYTVAAHSCDGVELFTDKESAKEIIENR